MKDRQVEQSSTPARIPFISAILHCVSMTVIVFMRSGFGYSYLRPKSVFLAFSWAFVLFTVYAWIEPGMWPRYAALCCFGTSAIISYWLHFSHAFATELHGSATHDSDSGVPHMIRILNLAGLQPPASFRAIWVIWAEPALVLAAALLARWPVGAVNLSTWLLIVAPCLWVKEALNYWFGIRKNKRQRDTLEDAEDGFGSGHAQNELALPTASRKAKVRRQRVW